MLGRLAHETRIHHVAADGDRLAAMENPSDASYRMLLGRIYCFESPLETAFAATPDFDRGLLQTHVKTRHLAADLGALGTAAKNLDADPVIGFDDPADALGWMYVIQRNTFLHGLLGRHLATKIPCAIRRAGSYLTAHESVAGARMRELGTVLDSVARRTYIADRIVHAANDAFRCQRQWYTCGSIQVQRSRPTTGPLQMIRAA